MYTFVINSPDPSLYTTTDGIVRADRIIPMDAAIKIADEDPIWRARARSIQAYVELEQSLSILFATVGNIEIATAGIVFFKITSSDARNKIIDRLLRKKHGNQFNAFWNSFLAKLRPIDLKRNEIVHWTTVIHAALDESGRMLVGVSLVPPNVWGQTPSTSRISARDLLPFIEQCDTFARLTNVFAISLGSEITDPEAKASWRDIFLRPLVYPLPPDHPLLQMPPTP